MGQSLDRNRYALGNRRQQVLQKHGRINPLFSSKFRCTVSHRTDYLVTVIFFHQTDFVRARTATSAITMSYHCMHAGFLVAELRVINCIHRMLVYVPPVLLGCMVLHLVSRSINGLKTALIDHFECADVYPSCGAVGSKVIEQRMH